MSEAANLRAVRVQYIVLDDSPAKLRDTRLQFTGEDQNPASVRRVNGQVLTLDRNPLNVRDVRAQFSEDILTPASIRRISGQFLLLDKSPVNVRDVRTQYTSDQSNPASLRRLNGMVMTRDKFGQPVKNVRLQYVEVVNDPPRFDIDPWQRLIAAINQNNNMKFVPAHFTHGNPLPASVSNKWNTQMEITALPASGFSGTTTIYFQRYAIGRIFDNKSVVLDLAGKITVHELIPQINTLFGTTFTTNDLENLPINHAGNQFTLRIASNSWFFIPGTETTYINVADLGILYKNVDLPGFVKNTGPLSVVGAKEGVSGIYPVRADDGSTFNAYVDMVTDGGYWVLLADWTGAMGTTLYYNDVIVQDQPLRGWTRDAVTRPIIPAGKVINKASQWMFQSDHATWKTLFGAYQKAAPVPITTVLGANGLVVDTPLGRRSVYGPRGGWSAESSMGMPFGLWSAWGAGGGCGGANVFGSTRECPVADSGAYNGHADYVSNKRLFVRAASYLY